MANLVNAMHMTREERRQEAEKEIALWVARYHGTEDTCGFSRIELLTLADAALERQRRFHVESLRDTPAGRAEAAALGREDG